jgi:hypothetical protein
MIILLTAALVAGTWYIYFSGNVKHSNTLIIFHIATSIGLLYTIYFRALKVIKKNR